MEGCIHYWKLDSTNYGRCIKCGDGRQFPSMSEADEEMRRHPAQIVGKIRRGRIYFYNYYSGAILFALILFDGKRFNGNYKDTVLITPLKVWTN